MLSEEQRERLVGATVRVVLAVRRDYLSSPGSNVLKHWDQIQARMLGAARTATSVGEWFTLLVRRLQIQAPSRELAAAEAALRAEVAAVPLAAWLVLVETEYGDIIARARLESERRREEAAASKLPGAAAQPLETEEPL